MPIQTDDVKNGLVLMSLFQNTLNFYLNNSFSYVFILLLNDNFLYQRGPKKKLIKRPMTRKSALVM